MVVVRAHTSRPRAQYWQQMVRRELEAGMATSNLERADPEGTHVGHAAHIINHVAFARFAIGRSAPAMMIFCDVVQRGWCAQQTVGVKSTVFKGSLPQKKPCPRMGVPAKTSPAALNCSRTVSNDQNILPWYPISHIGCMNERVWCRVRVHHIAGKWAAPRCFNSCARLRASEP